MRQSRAFLSFLKIKSGRAWMGIAEVLAGLSGATNIQGIRRDSVYRKGIARKTSSRLFQQKEL